MNWPTVTTLATPEPEIVPIMPEANTATLAGPPRLRPNRQSETTTVEIVCRNGRLSTREWLSDTARLTRPAQAVFLIWDPRAVYLRGCSPAIRDAQLGPPLVTYHLTPTVKEAPGGGVDSVLVYPADIEARLRP